MAMWHSRKIQHAGLVSQLTGARSSIGLKGLPDVASVETLAMQFVASIRREDYYRFIQLKSISAACSDPHSLKFNPERAVVFYVQQGDVDEAAWLIFLMTHFARPASGWKRLQDVYGRLGTGKWDWNAVRANPNHFYRWLAANWQSVGGAFGNHRKYESMNPNAKRAMRETVAEYLQWIGPDGHAAFFAKAIQESGNHPHTIFAYLYRTLDVLSFGRLAKFDYLCLIARYGLAPIEPGTAYLGGATGPQRGARLLVDGSPKSSTSISMLQRKLDELGDRLGVGMAIMEDALCNWQKSPKRFVHFKG